MPFEIIRNDITLMKVDAIVDTANPKVQIGAGVDSAIHKKAGEKLLEARRKIGDMKITEAAVTSDYNLAAKYVIHVVGPVWTGGINQEEQMLYQCYENALMLANKKHCESIAFPLISSGSYGFPKDKAFHVAVRAISNFLMNYEMQVYLVVFGNEAVALSEKLFKDIKAYVDEKYVEEKFLEEYFMVHEESNYLRARDFSYDSSSDFQQRIRNNEMSASLSRDVELSESIIRKRKKAQTKSIKAKSAKAPLPTAISERKLEDLFNELDESFSESLLRLIDQKGMKDPQVYKKANIDRKLFSKIRKNVDYQPKKSTAISLAIALELNLDETKDLISKAGYTLTHSNKSDVIVEYFIEHNNYDIFELNEVLFTFGLPVLSN